MARPEVFQYFSCRQYVSDYWSFYRASSKNAISIRSLASSWGLQSHSVLSRVFSGKQRASRTLVSKLADFWRLGGDEKVYLLLLCDLEVATAPEEKQQIFSKLLEAPQKIPVSFSLIKDFEVLSDPLCVQILELARVPGFKLDPHWLRKILRVDVALVDIRDKIELLLSTGYLQIIESGRPEVKYRCYSSEYDVYNLSVQRFHQKSCDLAKDSVTDVDVSLREFNSYCFNVSPDKIPEIKKYIRSFVSSLIRSFEENSKNTELYQFNSHFFPVSNKAEKEE